MGYQALRGGPYRSFFTEKSRMVSRAGRQIRADECRDRWMSLTTDTPLTYRLYWLRSSYVKLQAARADKGKAGMRDRCVTRTAKP